MSIKGHLIVTVLSAFYFGIGMGAQMWGIKAHLGLYPTLFIYSSAMILWMTVVFTSLVKIKKQLGLIKDEPQEPKITTDHINTK